MRENSYGNKINRRMCEEWILKQTIKRNGKWNKIEQHRKQTKKKKPPKSKLMHLK